MQADAGKQLREVMAKINKNDELTRWARIMSKGHGYAGVFNYENSDDKRVVETQTIEEWRSSLAAEYGVYTGVPQQNPNDPPDFHAKIGNKVLSVELVQLVEQQHKKRAVKGETPYAGQLFSDMQWSKDRLISKVVETIYKKGEKYQRKGMKIDVLLIHTAETWLNSGEAQRWMEGALVEPHPNILNVQLLFDYEPGKGVDHWPLLTIYGDPPF